MNTDRLISRAEVAGKLGVTQETVMKYVSEGRLPKPCVRLGNTASTDRWNEKVIVDFIAPPEKNPESPAIADPLFFSVGELSTRAGILQKNGFAILVSEGYLNYSPSDSFTHYRPTDKAFETGYFWRIEKHSKKNGGTYYQTVVTPKGKDPILKLLRVKTLYQIIETKGD